MSTTGRAASAPSKPRIRPIEQLPWYHQLVVNWLITDPNQFSKQAHKSITKNYQVQNYKGSRYLFIFGGRWRTLKSKPIHVAATIILLVPAIVFWATEARWWWTRYSPSVVILFTYVWGLCFNFFINSAVSDPGIVPRNIHIPGDLGGGLTEDDSFTKVIHPPMEYFNVITLPHKGDAVKGVITTWRTLSLLGFATITPLDVVLQTFGSQTWGIKIFVVIADYIVFFILLLVIYFLRMYKSRAALRDITSSSAYMPFEGDFPTEVFQAIDTKLSQCVGEIRVKAGPLYNEKEIINHPGLSPPAYVQKRNERLFKDTTTSGRLLPPDACYEDIIKSLGDKLMIDQKFLNSVEFPPSFTIRELMMFLVRTFRVEEQGVDGDKIVELYEKFRFGPDLIKEEEMFEFIVLFDKLGQAVHANQNGFLDGTPQDQNEILGVSLRGMPFASGRRRSAYGLDWASVFDEYDTASALEGMPEVSREMTRGTLRSVWRTSYVDLNEMNRRRPTRKSSDDSIATQPKDRLQVRPHPSFTSASLSSSLVRNRLSLSESRTSLKQRSIQQESESDDEFGVYDFRRKSIGEEPRAIERTPPPPSNEDNLSTSSSIV
ncbi:Defect at low temperature protein 1 [Scheffersomyces spartinae]|uniref:Defect at low temperature protein 1 n=1 Tax=Scheffersomyces spartinae TaxID=45513 RepID=A0A9P7V5Y5_9ASCO|nr:Defect at low temperature protein 1 [Scheffersomyces spartinae]KAG7191539.1 Defect at low temperature protein 1 [Scheffersomyces spartinae]